MNETIVRSAFGVVLTRVERPGAGGTEYRLSLPSGGPAHVFDNFADADAAWLFSLGGEPGSKPAPTDEARQIADPAHDREPRPATSSVEADRSPH